MATHRPLLIIGNWKMHKTLPEASDFVAQFVAAYTPLDNLEVGLAVPYTSIAPLAQLAQDKGSPLLIGAQNMNDCSEGAFTGEVAAAMLKEAGAQFVLLGHSERRRLFGEDDAFINRKVKKAASIGLRPVLCVGETEEEYEEKKTEAVLEQQLTLGLEGIPSTELGNLVIAYEPVWAIGTGRSATPKIAEEAHAFCRSVLVKLLTKTLAKKVPILYGGSVTPSNAASLLEQEEIDGLLIGGASLSLESFLQIVDDSGKILSS